jgi:hypothetical protein
VTSASWLDETLLVAISGLILLGLGGLLRMLYYDPAPALVNLSLRRNALRSLPARANAGVGLRIRDSWAGRLSWVRFALYALAVLAVVRVPIDLRWGPLGDSQRSNDYISTMWQVVAAALGMSVAMIAFAFQAFQSAGQRAYGGSLKEFARESGLVLLIEAGIAALLVDGVVLAGWGYRAPGGWAGGWAILVSTLALLLVGAVVHRVLSLLDDRALREMRTRRVHRLVQEAMRQQLTGQAADIWLANSRLGIGHAILVPAGFTPIYGDREGAVRHIWIGPLARFAARRRGLQLSLAVGLDQTVDASTALLYVRGNAEQVPRRLVRAIRIRPQRDDIPNAALSGALARLHQQAMTAATVGDELEWTAISKSYEQILLALPEAAAEWGVPFAGAVASPGFFGHGPVQQIAQFVYDELVAAVDSNSRGLIGPITYFPQRVASTATELGAPAIAGPMLGIFPAMYRLARQGR